jgi:hypothetical protein
VSTDDWRALLGDLDGQLLAAERAELEAEVADRLRRESADVPLADRLRASIGVAVRLQVRGAEPVRGLLEQVGPDWLLLQEQGGRTATLVALPAVLAVRDARPGLRAAEGVVAARFSLVLVLARLAREDTGVMLTMTDGTVVRGRLGRVGRDHVELDADADGAGRVLVATAAISLVRGR